MPLNFSTLPTHMKMQKLCTPFIIGTTFVVAKVVRQTGSGSGVLSFLS